MKVKTIHVGLMQTNCYVGYDEDTKEAFVVDPGDSAGRIIDFIDRNGLRVTHILLTHSHFDHIMALADVWKHTGAKVCIHELEVRCIEAPDHAETRSLRLPDLHIRPVSGACALKDGDVLDLCGEKMTVLHTPGHTRGSVCYDSGEVLFSGDTLFEDDCGRTDLPGGSREQMLCSLRRLYNLEGDRIVYPGHDVSTTLSRERAANIDMLAAISEVQ